MKFDEYIQEKKGIEKVALIIGCLCFISIVALIILNLGFAMDIHRNSNTEGFISAELLWGASIGLGIIGGILLDYKHILIAAISGLISGVILLLTTNLYLSWREEILYIEIILPMLFTAVIGTKFHKFVLNKLKNKT